MTILVFIIQHCNHPFYITNCRIFFRHCEYRSSSVAHKHSTKGHKTSLCHAILCKGQDKLWNNAVIKLYSCDVHISCYLGGVDKRVYLYTPFAFNDIMFNIRPLNIYLLVESKTSGFLCRLDFKKEE